MNVVIVGGGKASLILIDYFQSIDYIKLKGVVDLNPEAPGIVRAKALGVPTLSDIEAAGRIPEVEMWIEVTGSDKVRRMVVDHLKPTQHVMSSGAAKLMTDFIEIQNRRRSQAVDEVSGEFNHLTTRMKSSEEHIDQSIRKIEEVLQSMKIVAMNARIEAARAGESGKAFEVVVQAMQSTLISIENVLRDITVASESSKATIGELIATEQKLKASLKVN